MESSGLMDPNFQVGKAFPANLRHLTPLSKNQEILLTL